MQEIWKIFFLHKGFRIKISLFSGGKNFSSEAQDVRVDACIDKVIRMLILILEKYKNILLRREEYVSIKKLNLFIFPLDQLIYSDSTRRTHNTIPIYDDD